jgi:type III secretion protein J
MSVAGRIVRRFAVFLCLPALLFVCGCQVQLFGALTESEANQILAVLLDAGLAAEKRPGEEGVFSVSVEETEFAVAIRILDGRGLPTRRYDDFGNVFGKAAMFSTPLEEKARYLYAMQEELAHTVSEIDGVLSARVHLVLPEQDQLGRTLQTPSAAVFIKYVDDERHDPVSQRMEIRRLVAAGVPNLDEERIVVSFFPGADESHPAPSRPPWKKVLGLKLDEDSASRLWWMLGGIAGAMLLEATILVLLLRKGGK